MIDFEALNNLIFVWVGVGILFIVFGSILFITICCYYLLKINKLDNDNFKRRVKAAINECSTNSKNGK